MSERVQYEYTTDYGVSPATLKQRGEDGWLLTGVLIIDHLRPASYQYIFAREKMTPTVDRAKLRVDTRLVRNAFIIAGQDYNLTEGKEAFERIVNYLDGKISFGQRP